VEDVVMDLRVGMIEAWDSMGHLELFMALESALKIKFTTDEIMSLESLKEIEDNLLNKLSL
jgi:acyl carrier protein